MATEFSYDVLDESPGSTAAGDAVSGVQHITAHVDDALARRPEYLKEKPNFEALLSAIVAPMQDIEDAAFAVLTERAIDTAIGAQLDAIGVIVGLARNGLTDDVYRRYLRAQIATNNSEGTTNEILNIARLVVHDLTVSLVIVPHYPAAFSLVIAGAGVTADIAAIVAAFVARAKSAGVRVDVEYSTVDESAAFSFANGPGLGFGAGAFASLA
jgi:hypothetical protein